MGTYPFNSKNYLAYIPPSGDQSGATDVAAINAGLASGGSVQLAKTGSSAGSQYWINAPILPTSQARLWGSQWCSASSFDTYNAGQGAPVGTIINVAPGFSGAAFIDMYNTTATQFYGVDLAGFYVNGQNYSGAGTHGIRLQGAWGAGFIRGVTIFRCRGDGLHGYFDPTQFNPPDDWQVTNCKFSGCNGYGVYWYGPDSWFTDCESSEHSLDAWYLLAGANTRLTGCKGENSNGAGFHLGGMNAGQTLELHGCSTNLCDHDGFFVDNSWSGGLCTYLLDGCRSSGDGQSGGTTYAGFRSNGAAARVVGSGCVVVKNATGPAYGLSETGTSYGMCFTGSYVEGVTAATHDDGSNTHVLVNQSPVPF